MGTATIDTLLDQILARESSKDTDNPNDSGGRTKYGISQKWHPEAWVVGPPTRDAAKALYFHQYVVQPGFTQIKAEMVMDQLVDWGVNSGQMTAILHLQKVLNVKQDGVLGPASLQVVNSRDPLILNNQLVDDRILMLDRIVQKRPQDLEFLFGWHVRALSFRR